MILDGFDAKSIATAASALRTGELVGLPTETVYGLGADADNEAAIARIFTAKGRPAKHPLIVHVGDAAGVAHYASEVPDFARALIHAFWPGPLTLILRRQHGVAAAAAGGQDSIGLRCPSHPVAQALLKACHELGVQGIAAPSANLFGRVSPTTAAHVQSEFGADLLILDGGPCSVGIESSIIDCTRGVPVLLRPGAVTREQAQAACGCKVLLKEDLLAHHAPTPRASGTLESHYAPRAKVRLMDAHALQTALDLLGVAAPAGESRASPLIATYSRAVLKTGSAQVLCKRMPEDASTTARQLFAVLREFDTQGVQLIWVETPPKSPEWDGVRDRLQRAAAD